MKKIIYEWSTEEVDEYGDIIDNHFSDTFPGFPEKGCDVGLVKSSYATRDSQRGYLITKKGDRVGRTWAYVKNGSLPEAFEDGSNVPERFYKEMAS